MKPLVKKLKHLQNVAPSNDWKERNRTALLSEISKSIPATTEETEKQSAFNDLISAGFDMGKSGISFLLPQQKTFQLLKPAGVLFSVSLFVLSTGIFSVNASQSTIPGDTLYRLKLATERVQKALTSDEPEKAKLEIVFAGNRIEELEKIVSDPVTTEEEKSEQVEEVITIFNENIASAQETLEEIKDSESSQETVSLAEVIDEKTDEFKETLDEVAEGLTDESKTVVEDAATTAEEYGDEAFAVIVDKLEDGTVTANKEEVAGKVDDELDEIADLISAIDSEIDGLIVSTSTSPIIDSENSDDEASSNTASTTVEILDEQAILIEDAASAIEEAKSSSEDSTLSDTLSKIQEAKAIIKEVKEIIEDIADEQEQGIDEPEENVDENATSTEPIVEGVQTDTQIQDGETVEVSALDEPVSEETNDITVSDSNTGSSA